MTTTIHISHCELFATTKKKRRKGMKIVVKNRDSTCKKNINMPFITKSLYALKFKIGCFLSQKSLFCSSKQALLKFYLFLNPDEFAHYRIANVYTFARKV